MKNSYLTNNAKRTITEGINQSLPENGECDNMLAKDFSIYFHNNKWTKVWDYFMEWYKKQLKYSNSSEIYSLNEFQIQKLAAEYYDRILPAVYLRRILKLAKYQDLAPSAIYYSLENDKELEGWLFKNLNKCKNEVDDFLKERRDIVENIKENIELTAKQAYYISNICNELQIGHPHISTRKEASEWITKHEKVLDENNE